MIVSCPECAKKLRVDLEGGQGKRICCPKCSATFVAGGDEEMEPRRKVTTVAAKKRPPAPPDEHLSHSLPLVVERLLNNSRERESYRLTSNVEA
jgi:predicted Zn finger-like uncharacterized protein